jgi:hypothetical protein
MLEQLVEFWWDRPEGADGVTVATVGGRPVLFPRRRYPFRRYAPLGDESGLFLVFAETRTTEAGILDFVNKYGLLGHPAQASLSTEERRAVPPRLDDARAEPLDKWVANIRQMGEAVRLWRLVQAEDLAGLAEVIRWAPDGLAVYYRPLEPSSDVKEWEVGSVRNNRHLLDAAKPGDLITPARFCLMAQINQSQGFQGLGGFMAWDGQRCRPVVHLGTHSLHNLLWLQFALAVDGDKQYRQCRECGKWFEVSPGVNRVTRQTCSDTCRTKGFQRRREEARRLHAEGKGLKEIAEAVDSDVNTVRKWVTKRKG